MDEDGEADSLSEVSPCSLSCWMMKNLLHQETVPNDRLSLSVPDTVLLQDGHLFHWLFTSSKSGTVMKRGTKRLEWDGLIKFLVRCARTKGSKPPAEIIATARRLREGRTYPVMLTARDIRSLREKHNVHLLDEIVAVQPFVTKTPFTGCGLFETEFERKGRKRTSPATLATYELVRWPAEEVKWFDDFEPSCFDGLSRPQQRRRNGSAKRVHGVLHRGLARTTKQIVEHVERETGEVVLGVVAQYCFRPGSGQPTLLWLDSVRTVQSTQQQFGDQTPGEIVDPNSAFLNLTRELGEQKSGRSWTTFFPPKIGDLVSGGESLGFAEGAGVSSESQRLEFFRSTTEQSRKAQIEARVESSVNLTAEESSHVPLALADANETPLDGIFSAAAGAVEQSGSNGICEEENFGRFKNIDGPGGGFQRRQHFTLPTESWAYRSAGRRGLYFSGAGLGASADRPLSEQWPRKRSTGTTMRLDCHRERLDLRSAAENQRPWTAPSTQAANIKRGGGVSELECGPVGVNGCYGDYCHYAGTWSSHRSSKSSAAEGGVEANSAEALRLVSYRSILKSRAEETVLCAWSRPQSSPPCKLEIGSNLRKAGCGGKPEALPTLTGSGEKDLRLMRQVKKKGELNFASLISERMRLLAASLIDRGGGQYFTLGSSNRATAGPPDAAQRAIEELVYEQALSYLHPTTASRSVAVCDTCAMVYGYMDKFRRQTKEIRATSGESTRAARIAVARQRRRQQQDRCRPHTAAPDGQGCPPLRRYSDLHLGVRPATSDGLNR